MEYHHANLLYFLTFLFSCAYDRPMKVFRSTGNIAMNRALIIALICSFVFHAVVLAIPVMGRRSAPPPHPESLINVKLTESPPPEPDREATPASPRPAGPAGAATAATAEDTVNLGSPDRRYRSYLLKVRRRIESRWSYPEQARERNEEGVTTVRFSLDDRGVLSGQDILASSGSSVLDEHSLAVIRAAAPYDRLPEELSLSRLHIVASFHYRLK